MPTNYFRLYSYKIGALKTAINHVGTIIIIIIIELN